MERLDVRQHVVLVAERARAVRAVEDLRIGVVLPQVLLQVLGLLEGLGAEVADEVTDIEVAPLVVLPVVAVFEAAAARSAAEGPVLAVGSQVCVQAALGFEAGAAQVTGVVSLVRVNRAVRGQVARADDLTTNITRGTLLMSVPAVFNKVRHIFKLRTTNSTLFQLAALHHVPLQHSPLISGILLPTPSAHFSRMAQLMVSLLLVREERLCTNIALEALDLRVLGF